MSSGGPVTGAVAAPGRPVLRWASRAHSIEAVQAELGRIWSSVDLAVGGDGGPERRVAARTSVMNLVVVAARSEAAEHAAGIVNGMTGRHPSRTIIVSHADPDGPAWLDAQVQAHCVMPRADAPETCAELVYMTAGGETGAHLAGVVAPLLVHDLPVTLWWAGEPDFRDRRARDLLGLADRLVVDGSAWRGDGLDRLVEIARLQAAGDIAVADFALLRQSRWREAIASSFDRPLLRPFLGGFRRVEVTYAAHGGAPRSVNVVRPLYHAAWLASRLGLTVAEPLQALPGDWAGYAGTLRSGRRRVAVTLRPVDSASPSGATLGVRIAAERPGARLIVDVRGGADAIHVHAEAGGEQLPERVFLAPRRTEVQLLTETLEAVGADRVSRDALAAAAAMLRGV
jgi:glucose-6-phosphate dehydrogenase assembly protein OpcA